MSTNTTHTEIARNLPPELAQLGQARQLLEASRDLAEVKSILDIAVAAERYAQAKKLGTDAIGYATEIVNRSERRYGQLLAETPKDTGGRPKTGAAPEPVSPHRQAGKKLSARSQQLARLDEATFEANVRRSRASLTALARQAEAERLRRDPPPPPASLGSFPVLLADPPWRYDPHSSDPGRAIENHYPTMALEDIKALRIPAAEDAVLFLWATPPLLMKAGEVMAAWGFATGRAWCG